MSEPWPGAVIRSMVRLVGEVGGESLIDWSRRYGFGEKTGVELAEDVAGLIADNTWKQKNYNRDWTEGDTVNMSIGQGYTQATPLQVAVMFAVPANGGQRVKPHFDQKANEAKTLPKSLNLNPETLKTLREGLRAVVKDGTGKAVNSAATPSCCREKWYCRGSARETSCLVLVLLPLTINRRLRLLLLLNIPVVVVALLLLPWFVKLWKGILNAILNLLLANRDS